MSILSSDNSYYAIPRLYRDLIIGHYVNHEKLSVLFEKWYMDVVVAAEHYNVSANSLAPFGEVFPRSRAAANKNYSFSLQRLRRLIGVVAARILAFSPFKRVILPGGNITRLDAIHMDSTLFWLKRVHLDVDIDLLNCFLEKVLVAHGSKIQKYVQSLVPRAFFFKEWHALVFSPLTVRGSPLSFHDPNYVKLLFLSSEIELIGFVHGAFYGEFADNRVEEFEKDISDTYFHWGLGDCNVTQFRFPSRQCDSFVNVSTVFWIGTSPCNHFLDRYFVGYRQISAKADEVTEFAADQWVGGPPLCYLSHPQYPNSRFNFDTEGRLDDMDLAATGSGLFIIDRPGITFLYRAIYQDIRFVLIYSWCWRKFLSRAFNKFLDMLDAEGFIVWADQVYSVEAEIRRRCGADAYSSCKFVRLREYLETN